MHACIDHSGGGRPVCGTQQSRQSQSHHPWHVCVCVCVCERDKEREKKYVCVCVCVCVCDLVFLFFLLFEFRVESLRVCVLRRA